MQLQFICPYWGQEGSSASHFVSKVKEAGYDGVEVNFPSDKTTAQELVNELKENNLLFIAQQWLPPATESISEYTRRFEERIESLAELKPLFINSHTGKDFFSFDDNCRIIEAGEAVSLKTGIPLLHETHRGRFSFHSFSLLPYIKTMPQLKLTADLSHWCTVSESMLDDQREIVDQMIPHFHYIHARVGYEHSPQVNDPRAPEWNGHLARYLSWWDGILNYHQNGGKEFFPVCPEFGPPPYMPLSPYTTKPLSDQWALNVWMMQLLKERYSNGDLNG